MACQALSPQRHPARKVIQRRLPGGCSRAFAAADPPDAVCSAKALSDKIPDMSSPEAWKKAFVKDGMSNKGHPIRGAPMPRRSLISAAVLAVAFALAAAGTVAGLDDRLHDVRGPAHQRRLAVLEHRIRLPRRHRGARLAGCSWRSAPSAKDKGTLPLRPPYRRPPEHPWDKFPLSGSRPPKGARLIWLNSGHFYFGLTLP